jgi:hypothetical protein
MGRYRGFKTAGEPLRTVADYRKALNVFAHQSLNEEATQLTGYTLDLLVKIKDKPKAKKARKESTVGGDGGEEFIPNSIGVGGPPKKTRDDMDCDFIIDGIVSFTKDEVPSTSRCLL